MGTNYYRIPTESEIKKRKKKLQNRIASIDTSSYSVISDFKSLVDSNTNDRINVWDEFTKDCSIHLGKRSSGWKFFWNFHKNKYYSTKEELIEFVLNGRVVDEYGKEENPKEFLDMAFSWCQLDGLVVDKEYFKNHDHWLSNLENYYDIEIDGLRVSQSTQFC